MGRDKSLIRRSGLHQPTLRQRKAAKQSQSSGASRVFVKKIEYELITFGRVLLPNALQKNHDIPHGPGSCCFDNFDP